MTVTTIPTATVIRGTTVTIIIIIITIIIIIIVATMIVAAVSTPRRWRQYTCTIGMLDDNRVGVNARGDDS